MKIYYVRVYIPSYYEIPAENADEAREQALQEFSKEHKSWMTPESQVVELMGAALPLP
jgi:hypothetical protein